jgi:hypothetical protein
MTVQYPLLFGDQILPAKMIEKESAFNVDKREWVIEVDANGVHVQVQPPAFDCILIAASPEEKEALEKAGYQLNEKF